MFWSIKRPPATSLNAKTGEKLAGVDVDSFKKVRVNNALRSAIAGGARRADAGQSRSRTSGIAAAEAVFKSRDVKALPALEAQLAKESDPRAAAALRQARAAILALDAERADVRPPGRDRGAQGARRSGRPEPARPGRGHDRRSGAQERRASGARFDQDAPGDVGRRAEPLVRRLGRLRCCCSPRSASPSPSA